MNEYPKWMWWVGGILGLVLLVIIGVQSYYLIQLPNIHAQELQTIQQEKNEIKSDKISLETEKEELTEQYESLRDEIDDLVKLIEERDEAHEEAINELNSTIQELENSLEDAEKKVRRLESENQQLKKDLEARARQQATIASAQNNSSKSSNSSSDNSSSQTSSGSSNELKGFQVTWYNITGTTASGRPTEDGVSIAVDPNIIPLGTWVRLTFPDGTVMERRADDTGGHVRGKVIDIYKNASTERLLALGRAHNVKVEILK